MGISYLEIQQDVNMCKFVISMLLLPWHSSKQTVRLLEHIHVYVYTNTGTLYDI